MFRIKLLKKKVRHENPTCFFYGSKRLLNPILFCADGRDFKRLISFTGVILRREIDPF